MAPYAWGGFLVLASQYRGVSDEDPSGPKGDQFGGQDVRDVVKLMQLVNRIPEADPDKVVMVGASRGAMMSFLAARQAPRIRAIAVIAGVSDLNADLARNPRMERVYQHRIPGYATDKHGTLAARSVIHWAEHLPRTMPVLIVHGALDNRVHVSQSVSLHKRLKQLAHPSKLVIYPQGDHHLSQHRNEATAEILGWFRAALSAKENRVGANNSSKPTPLRGAA